MRASEVETAILVDLLLSGDNSAGNIGPNTGHPNSSVTRSLSSLVEEGLVRNKGSGVYTLTDKGRTEARTIARQKIDIYPD